MPRLGDYGWFGNQNRLVTRANPTAFDADRPRSPWGFGGATAVPQLPFFRPGTIPFIPGLGSVPGFDPFAGPAVGGGGGLPSPGEFPGPKPLYPQGDPGTGGRLPFQFGPGGLPWGTTGTEGMPTPAPAPTEPQFPIPRPQGRYQGQPAPQGNTQTIVVRREGGFTPSGPGSMPVQSQGGQQQSRYMQPRAGLDSLTQGYQGGRYDPRRGY